MFSALIIDSDDSARLAIENTFAPSGADFSSTADASEALNLARAAAPDLIFLRVELPNASGFSICNKLRRNAATNGIPLVLYASDVTDDVFDQHRNLKTHADVYLKLPFDPSGLRDAVGGLVELGDAGAEDSGVSDLDIELEDDAFGDIEAEFEDDDLKPEEVVEEVSGAVPVDPEIADETEDAFAALMMDDDDEAAAPPPAPEPEPEPEPLPFPVPATRLRLPPGSVDARRWRGDVARRRRRLEPMRRNTRERTRTDALDGWAPSACAFSARTLCSRSITASYARCLMLDRVWRRVYSDASSRSRCARTSSLLRSSAEYFSYSMCDRRSF